MSDPVALATALRASGIPCDVESRAGLALIVTTALAAGRLAEDDVRRGALALAREHGFTHVAVELSADAPPAGAPLLRD
jgi:hypothetical protein